MRLSRSQIDVIPGLGVAESPRPRADHRRPPKASRKLGAALGSSPWPMDMRADRNRSGARFLATAAPPKEMCVGTSRNEAEVSKASQKFVFKNINQGHVRTFRRFSRLLIAASVLISAITQSAYASASEVDHFEALARGDAPLRLQNYLGRLSKTSLSLSWMWFDAPSHDAPAGRVSIVRMSSNQCDDAFCPTYIEYAGAEMHNFILSCKESVRIYDPHSSEQRWSAELICTPGKVLVNFTELGPAFVFLKPE